MAPETMHAFRSLLLSIAQELTSSELKELKFACDETIPDGVLEKITAPHQLFTELEHRGLLSETEKDYLAELLLNIGRQKLARKLLGMDAPRIKRSCSLLCGSLPGKVPHFFGRTLVCEEVIAAIHENRNHLVTITGPPGYGKSSVAISVGHQMVEEYEHHVYYASTRGAASVESVAFQLLYSFGIVAGEKPLMQTQHYLESLHRKTLLIFDNAEDMLQPHLKEKFLHFIKLIGEMAPHVNMVITSRVALTFYSFVMKNIQLLPLTHAQSAQLIRIFAPQEISNAHAESLGRLSKGVPLLVRAVASLLAQNVDPDLLIKEFERSPGTTLLSLTFDGMPPEFDMYPCLQLCFERLKPEEQGYLISLAVFPSSFNVVDASCVLRNLSDLKRQMIITKLANHSLVRPDTEGRSFFAVHSIVRIFCLEVIKDDEERRNLYEQSLTHFNMYFLAMLQDLNTKFYQSADDLRAVMVSFECKKNNIFLALENAIRENKLLKYAGDVLNSVYRFFTVRLSSNEFRRIYHDFAEIFKKSGDMKRYSNCLVSLGFHQFWVMCSCRRPCPKATKLFEEARANFVQLQQTNSDHYAECLSKLARSYAYDRDLKQCVEMIQEAKSIVDDGNVLFRLSIINDLAAAHSYHDDHNAAIQIREEFLPTAKEYLSDHPAIGTLYDELGSSYEALNNVEKSIEYRKEAIDIFDGFLGDHKFTASCYLGLGTTLKSEGKYEEALEALRKAFDVQRKTIGPHTETVITSQEIAKVLLKLGRTSEAEEWNERAVKLTEDQKIMEKKLETLQL